MNRLLTRQRLQAPARATPTPARPSRPPAAAAQASTGVARVLRRPLVLALVAGASAVLAMLAWALLSSPSDPSTGTSPSVLVRPRATTAPATPTPASAGATEGGHAALSGRNPFGDEEASTPASPTTPADAEPSATANSAPTSAPAPAPTSARTSTAGASPATVTVTVGPTYVGLYAWNGDRASFRVNARSYSVHVGTSFGPGLRFTAVVAGTPRCAKVQHREDTFTLCPGQVTTVT